MVDATAAVYVIILHHFVFGFVDFLPYGHLSTVEPLYCGKYQAISLQQIYAHLNQVA